jgi:predicted RNA-binding protein with PIN domain
MMAAVFLHMIIDGRNVMRSSWPNAGERELVSAIARWAGEHPRTPIVAVVFDGTYEGEGPGMYEHDERVVVVATQGEIADDVIVREVEELRAEREPVIVATSDRELRERVEALGAKVVGGGSFLRSVLP